MPKAKATARVSAFPGWKTGCPCSCGRMAGPIGRKSHERCRKVNPAKQVAMRRGMTVIFPFSETTMAWGLQTAEGGSGVIQWERGVKLYYPPADLQSEELFRHESLVVPSNAGFRVGGPPIGPELDMDSRLRSQDTSKHVTTGLGGRFPDRREQKNLGLGVRHASAPCK
jgi:hypothetical protein